MNYRLNSKIKTTGTKLSHSIFFGSIFLRLFELNLLISNLIDYVDEPKFLYLIDTIQDFFVKVEHETTKTTK